MLFPALNELSTFVGSLASADEVDVAYIVKKLTGLVGYDVNLAELSVFLADHLHFQYIGFLIDGELYGSRHLTLPPEALKQISAVKKNSGSIWLVPDASLSAILRRHDISAVAELRDAKGHIVGKLLCGRPAGRISFENRDLVPVEIVLQVIPVVTHPGNHRIKKHLL